MVRSEMILRMNETLLVSWLICVALANGVWIVVFKSPLLRHVLSLRATEELLTQTDVETFFLERRMWFAHNLWVCGTCQAVWTAAFATLALVSHNTALISWIPVTFLATLPFTKWTQKHL